MRSNVWFTAGALLAALPLGYCAGLLAAFAMSRGFDIGQGPLLTIPIGLLLAIAFALVPILDARTRFTIITVAAIVSVGLVLLVRPSA
jgi:hypothetical protein